MVNDISLYKRDTKNVNVTVTSGTTGSAIDLTGYTMFFTVKSCSSDADADATISKTGTTFAEGTQGKCTFSLTSSDTDVSVGTYYYDIQMKDTGSNITTLVKGNFNVEQDITARES